MNYLKYLTDLRVLIDKILRMLLIKKLTGADKYDRRIFFTIADISDLSLDFYIGADLRGRGR